MTDCCNAIAANGGGRSGLEPYRVNAPGPVMKLIPWDQKVSLLSAANNNLPV